MDSQWQWITLHWLTRFFLVAFIEYMAIYSEHFFKISWGFLLFFFYSIIVTPFFNSMGPAPVSYCDFRPNLDKKQSDASVQTLSSAGISFFKLMLEGPVN